ncbi:MAG TPA: sigma-70 family RNA polymerase sigma factor, partial [bacterium]|nr:sigma-70 family RNA polymerase sigma factor [bacterium]
MVTSSDEQLFRAFRRHRDVDALATLFHRRADELLRLALFLSPRPSEAEDLVQATFLSAIARAETFRDGHRVMSWLCGILTNHARMLRRAERRPQPERPPAGAPAPDPAALAAQSELRSALSNSIAQLREPYRSVLRLHLHDGLNSAEISQRLQRAPATVRKQMARALEQLRSALPVGLATGLLLRMNPAQIAQRAAEAAQFVDGGFDGTTSPVDDMPVGVPAATHGGVKLLTAAALLLLAASALWSALANEPAERPAQAPPSAGGADGGALARTAASAQRETARGTPTEPRAVADAGFTLAFQAHRPDGSPHAAIEVLCVPDDGSALPLRLLRHPVRRATTDGRGIGRFAGLAPGRYELLSAGSLPRAAVHIVDRDADCVLRLPAATRVRGTVVDPAGRPVAGAVVLASQTAGRGDRPTAIARTDANGWFDATCLLAAGRIFARHAEHGQSVSLRLEPGRRLQLQLEPLAPAVTVIVRDRAGAPVADAVVAVIPKSQDTAFYAPHTGVTDAAGRCTLPAPGRRPASVLAQPRRLAPARVDLPVGAARAEIVVPEPVHLAGVCRHADGRPLADRVLSV